jgi:mRNA-degrading endonuclease toxin of MazEF toxin-antitoxin module
MNSINEIKMTTTALKTKALSTGAKVGIEFEVVDGAVNDAVIEWDNIDEIKTLANVTRTFELSAEQKKELRDKIQAWLDKPENKDKNLSEYDYFSKFYDNDAKKIQDGNPRFAIDQDFTNASEIYKQRRNNIMETLEKYISIVGWTNVSDYTIGQYGVEIVSPALPISGVEHTINKMREFASKENYHTNEKCGLHINVSVPNFSHDNLDYLKLCILVGDAHVLEKFGRTTNKYCKSSLNKIREIFHRKNSNMAAIIDKITNHLNDTMNTQASIVFSDLTNLIPNITEKYSSIGIKDNRIEFRAIGGDWLSRDANDVLEMVYRFTYCLYAACNPEVEKKEYLSKLYKFLYNNVEDKTSPMLSSLVLSGLMTPKEAIEKLSTK